MMNHHHALHISLPYPSHETLQEVIKSFFANVEHEIYIAENLKIDDARMLIDRAQRKGTSKEGIHVIGIGFHRATLEAQNALLKIFEEPPQSTRFVVVAPAEALLETIISRLYRVECNTEVTLSNCDAVNQFREYDLKKRLEYIATLETKHEANLFIQGIIYCADTEKLPHSARALCEACLRYLSSPSASVKQILETVAVALPNSHNSDILT